MMTEHIDPLLMTDAWQSQQGTMRLSVDLSRATLPPVRDLIKLLVTRERLEQAADTIIELLDELDGDSDNEPSLGSIGSTAGNYSFDQRRWALGSSDDTEEEDLTL